MLSATRERAKVTRMCGAWVVLLNRRDGRGPTGKVSFKLRLIGGRGTVYADLEGGEMILGKAIGNK